MAGLIGRLLKNRLAGQGNLFWNRPDLQAPKTVQLRWHCMYLIPRTLVDRGNSMSAGVEVTKEGVTELELGLDSFTGYSSINAEDMDAAIALAKTNSMITSVVVHDLSRM